jgi:hypothetical protein
MRDHRTGEEQHETACGNRVDQWNAEKTEE